MGTGQTAGVTAAATAAVQAAVTEARAVLEVSAGQVLAARVVSASDGLVELALAGGRLIAASELPMEPGQTVRLQVAEAGADRIALRLLPATAMEGAAPEAATQGLPPAAARALAASLAALPPEMRTGELSLPLAQLAQRAADVGVRTPAQADAMVRLLSAGLPATAASVAGLADLAEGPPIGRALAMLAAPATPEGAAQAAAGERGATAPAVVIDDGPPPATAAQQPRQGGTAAGQPAAQPAPAQAQASPAAVAAETAPDAGTAPRPAGAGSRPATEPLRALAEMSATLSSRAAAGDADDLRTAVRGLGTGLEARLQRGEAPDGPTLRGLLLEVANDPSTPPHHARLAERTADAIAAQSLAPPALAPQSDPVAQGAYLQIPLPGGQSAEVRVMPDAEGEGGASGDRTTRVAFLLTMSSLGQLVVEASVGPTATDAVVRAASADVRGFLEGRTEELAEALERARPTGRGSHVTVERMTGAPAGLLPAPPASGLDLSA